MIPERPPLQEQAAARLVIEAFENGRALWLWCEGRPLGPDHAVAAFAAAALGLIERRRMALDAALDLDRAGAESPAWELAARALDTWRPAVTLADLANLIRAAAAAGAQTAAILGAPLGPWIRAQSDFAGALPPAPGADTARALCEAKAAIGQAVGAFAVDGAGTLAAVFGAPASDLAAATGAGGLPPAVLSARRLADRVGALDLAAELDTEETAIAAALEAALDLVRAAPDLGRGAASPALPGMRPPPLDLALTVLAAVALDLPAVGAGAFGMLLADLTDRAAGDGDGDGGPPAAPSAPSGPAWARSLQAWARGPGAPARAAGLPAAGLPATAPAALS